MSRRPIVFTATLIAMLFVVMPRDAEAVELFRVFHRRHQPPSATAVVHYQQAQRWYPQYQAASPQENYGGGVPTYAYGYFGAKVHSSHGWHYGYYGDLYGWGPLRGR